MDADKSTQKEVISKQAGQDCQLRNAQALKDEMLEKQQRFFKWTIIGMMAILIILACFMCYIFFSIQKNSDILQEQINYIYSKDNLLETSFNRLVSGQKDILDGLSEKKFSDYMINDTKNAIEPTPFDHIKKDQIMVTENRVIIKNDNVNWAEYTDTGSMEPVLSQSANGIEIKPASVEDIHVGDIISYYYDGKVIVHRVVRIGIDRGGWYAVTKADTSDREDPQKVRFSQLNGILIGIIY